MSRCASKEVSVQALVVRARIHRRAITVAVLALLLIGVAFEVGARAVRPDDAMELIEHSLDRTHIIYDGAIHDTGVVQSAYTALMSTPVPISIVSDQRGYHSTLLLDPILAHRYIIRFLWHGLPVAVATHDADYGIATFFSCSAVGQVDRSVSSGGVTNPRPFLNRTVIALYPSGAR